jgi:epoxyqueuosine reductase
VAQISRYAWGDDYHDIVKTRLKALRAWMEEAWPDAFDSRVYVDTGPVQERVYAQYAGLGWVGKNTCLINPELGSWLFLGVIITTLALEPDAQGLERCGSCTRCLDACPTGALVEPGMLDAQRCISYLTIETRGPVPVEHLEAMGTHVYGCDICQEVCPFNQPAPVSSDPHWQPRPGLDLPALVELAERSDDAWDELRRHSAMKRVPLELLRRNLVIALANAQTRER